ncbi:MAG: pyrroline-5-carboxylate reductase [Alistipes sp.]
MKLAILGGGNMGGAIAFGAVDRKIVAAVDVTISHPSRTLCELLEQHGHRVELTTDNRKAVEEADVVVVAVKPWLAEEVFGEIATVLRPNQIVVSIVASATLSTLASYLGKPQQPIFRVIPNTAITLGRSATFVCHQHATEAQCNSISALFEPLGALFFVEEAQMEAVTALSSCGIAYAFKYIDAAVTGGVTLGVDRAQALRIVMQTIEGALALLDANNSQPQTEIDKVTTPGGITLRGLAAMEQAGFSQAVIAGLKASK